MGGGAIITSNNIEGGMVMGGSAATDSNHVFHAYAGVWFLNESGNGTTDEFVDSSPLGLHGTGGYGEADYTPTQMEGINCDYCQYFDSVNDLISFPQDPLKNTNGFSVSFWTKIDTQFQQRAWYSRGIDTYDGSSNWVFTIGHTYINHVWVRVQMDDGTIHNCASTNTLQLDKWYHVACSWHPSNGLKTYINGVADGTNTDATGTLMELTNDSEGGAWNGQSYCNGYLYDLRLHPEERSAAWFLAEHDDYCGGLYTIGNTESATYSFS